MKLELYYAPKTCALVPYVTLTEAGADFTVHNMNSRSGALKTPEYLKLNPKHKVPVLVIDGEPLTENVAIQIFIHRAFPQAKLLPQDPKREIKAISLMACMPMSTTLRKIDLLAEVGLLSIVPDLSDGRRSFVQLSAKSREMLRRYLEIVRRSA